MHYLAAEKVINLANEVFGFNGWSSEIKNVQIDFVDESTSGKITLGLSVISRVTLRDGAFHEDVGYGHIENCKGKAAAFEKAKKEAATDAMKRALRNFGNVLGNCLYDKDYLARVTKVKVAPSKWDAENLHRHPDYAPIKRESVAEVDDAPAMKAAPPARLQSAVSNGAEYEDDYGGNLFDDVDLNHPDEVRLDDTPVRATPNGSSSAAANRQPMNRVASMPAMRTSNGVQQPPRPPNVQQPPRPPGPPQQHVNNSNNIPPNQNNGNSGRMLPPQNQISNQGQRVPQQPNGIQQNGHPLQRQLQDGAAQNADGNRSSSSSASSTTQQGKSANTSERLTPPGEADHAPAPPQLTTPQGAPVGFVSGKAASVLNQVSGGEVAIVKPFDPHHESPSIRRTQGIDLRKSGPVRRADIGVPTPPIVQKGPPAKSVPAPAGVVPGRPNVANSGMDPGRRIGAPGNMQSPMANRNSYKPPSMLKRAAPSDAGTSRPALTDVSNMQQAAQEGHDAKKQKVEPAAQSAPNEASTTAS